MRPTPTRIVIKQCLCGKRYTISRWLSLRCVGVKGSTDYVFEHRICDQCWRDLVLLIERF